MRLAAKERRERTGKTEKLTAQISVALTWDGARWPTRALPPKARAFLGSSPAPSAHEIAKLFGADSITELRICWVPRLKGGPEVLSAPFHAQSRLAFKATRAIPFGDILGVVYRRTSGGR